MLESHCVKKMTNWANYGKWRHPEKRKEILENWENSKKMNKERYNQIIDDVYDNYKKEIIRQREAQKKHVEKLRSQGKRLKVTRIELLTKDEFIDKIKTNTEFSEKWGLQIEERELTPKERIELAAMTCSDNEV